MLRSALLSLACLAGCSSSEFQVANDDAGDSATIGSETATETALSETSVEETIPVDTKPDPCAEDPSKAKFCIEVKLSGEHPGYGGGEATELRIDGKGRVYILLYDKDPLDATPASPAKIVASIPYPPDTDVGAQVSVDDLPVTIPGTIAAPGSYTAVAFFADSTKMRGTGDTGILPGDFVTVPTAAGTTFSYPKLDVKLGKTVKVTMPIRAVRGVTLTLKPTAALKTKGATVHGDGPVLFGLHDGTDVTGSTAWHQLNTVGCVDLDVDAFAPRSQDVTFNTVADTTHNIFAAIFDYSSTDPAFPGQGTLVSAQSGALPKLVISKDLWTAKASVDLIDVAFGAVPIGTPDKLTCPAPM